MEKIRLSVIISIMTFFSYRAMAHITADNSRLDCYKEAYTRLCGMLQTGSTDFKTAVFYVENAYYDNKLSYHEYNNDIKGLAALATAYLRNNAFLYPESDSTKISKYAAVFKIMTDSIPIKYDNSIVYHFPYRYNFSDFNGTYWPDMFVTTLLATHKGNCHSMPYLYKLILQEMGSDACLSLAPNHIYIKLFSKKDGWYNTELTSGDFPLDAWIMASGYVHLSAIQNGIYMDTIGNTKSIAMCLVDLAQGLDSYSDGPTIDSFILDCCNTALIYFPNYINALLLQSKVYERQFSMVMKVKGYKSPQDYIDQENDGAILFDRMSSLAAQIHDLGYRRMPLKMYMEWLAVLKTQRDKYSNKKITNFKK